jgi:hypothetical protein
MAIDWRFGDKFNIGAEDIVPSIALSDRGDLVEVHSESGILYLSIGSVGQDVGMYWFFRHVKFSSGYSPVVAINRDGFVIVVANYMAQRFYSAGQVIAGDDPRGTTVSWFVNNRPYGVGKGDQSVALTSDGIVVEVDQSDGKLFWNAGRAMVDAKSARDRQRWLKYSGRWGRKGDPPHIDILGIRLASVGDGPEGPAFKDSWIAGPDE